MARELLRVFQAKQQEAKITIEKSESATSLNAQGLGMVTHQARSDTRSEVFRARKVNLSNRPGHAFSNIVYDLIWNRIPGLYGGSRYCQLFGIKLGLLLLPLVYNLGRNRDL